MHQNREKQIENPRARRRKNGASIAAGAEEPTRREGSTKPLDAACPGVRSHGAVSPGWCQPSGAPSLPCLGLLGRWWPHAARPCAHLNDPPAQPCHVRQLLKRLCVGVVVLSKLCLHDLWREERGAQGKAGEPWPLPAPRPSCPTCSCSAVKEVRALLAGFGWLSCSEGTAPSSVIPLPTGEKSCEPQVRNPPAPSPLRAQQLLI